MSRLAPPSLKLMLVGHHDENREFFLFKLYCWMLIFFLYASSFNYFSFYPPSLSPLFYLFFFLLQFPTSPCVLPPKYCSMVFWEIDQCFLSCLTFRCMYCSYLHIYTSNGVSLHELAISLSKERKFSANDNDDLCIICHDGGDLLCCDGCPRAFHLGEVLFTSYFVYKLILLQDWKWSGFQSGIFISMN